MPVIEEVEEEAAAPVPVQSADAKPEECQAPAGDGPDGRRRAAETSGGAAAGANEGEDGEPVKELTEEEKKEQEEKLVRARALKEEGNALFGSYEYDAAIKKYSSAIEEAPEGHKEQAVFFNNRATCYFKQAWNHPLKSFFGHARTQCTHPSTCNPMFKRLLTRVLAQTQLDAMEPLHYVGVCLFMRMQFGRATTVW